jgi:hypothetical protein
MSDKNLSSYKRIRETANIDNNYETGDERGGFTNAAMNSGGMNSLRDA